ncbi:MAG TPA: hypothetical protein VFT95_05760 [Micromonosporaceae bacterium]|nr:hypothetical protein [Micromonosporaceae bacterium]
MPADSPGKWILLGFTERFAAWVDLETIDARLGRVVADWIETRRVDPYHGAIREDRVPGLWWARIPSTLHKGDFVAICSYWIDPAKREVRCDNFGSAPWTV